MTSSILKRRRAPDVAAAAQSIEAFLHALGFDLGEEKELQSTGKRVAEAFAHEFLRGYDVDPAIVLKDATTSTNTDMVVVSGIRTITMCPHHLLPAIGTATVGYLPGNVVGFGAVTELVTAFSRRLVLQEDLGRGIVDAVMTHTNARAAACWLDLQPMCLCARGDEESQAHTVTCAFAGEESFRASFLAAVRGKFG